MYETIIFILGIVIGAVIIYLMLRHPIGYKDGLIKKQEKDKQENLEKILEFVKDKDQITNNDVEKFLKVSDATATRYLDELESQGKLKQVGDEGKHVYYKKI